MSERERERNKDRTSERMSIIKTYKELETFGRSARRDVFSLSLSFSRFRFVSLIFVTVFI